MKRDVILLAVGVAVVVAIATIAVQVASDAPDGLEYVAEREGLADADSTSVDAPLAGYGEELGGSESRNVAVAGLVGVLVTLGIGFGVFWLVRTGRHGADHAAGR